VILISNGFLGTFMDSVENFYMVPLTVSTSGLLLSLRSGQIPYEHSKAMYPTLVIALVTRETSILEECASRVQFTSMQFAVPSMASADRASRAVRFLTEMTDPRSGAIASTPDGDRSMKAELHAVEV
jgi:hypothetical protein